MKKTIGRGWRPLVGVVAVGVLALGVSALAGPRSTDKPAARGGDQPGVQATRLVTGDPAQINAVVAGTPPSAILAITPVAAKVGAYAADCTITGNTLACDAGGFRAWLEVKLSHWDDNGDNVPPLKVFQIKQDCTGYMSGKGDPLANPVIPCTSAAPCAAAFGESWTKCEDPGTGFQCKAGYNDKSGTKRPADNWCAEVSSGSGESCDSADVATTTCNYNFFGIYSGTRTDNHIVYYGGTEVIDVPAAAKGMYCVSLNHDETFLADTAAPPNDIATAQENGFCINVRTGSCCYGLGTPSAGCVDNVMRSECPGSNPTPALWTDGKLCSAGCVECVNDAGCDDHDSCTTESCNTVSGLCTRGKIAGWTADKCCEGSGAAAVLTAIDDGDACTADACVNATPTPPPAQENGTATHTPATGPCDDGNPCTVGDHCDGVHTEAAGGCSGTDVNTLSCASDADCPLDPLGVHYTCGTATAGKCFCTLVPNVQFVLSPSNPKLCAGGFRAGLPCAVDADCTGGGTCNNFANGANCFDQGDKITAVVHVGSAGSPINGGSFLMTYNPSCVKFNSATCLAPYGTTVYGPSVNTTAGTIYIACGVDPFGGVNGPLGNTNMVSLSFTKNGACDNCDLCFADANPMHSLLVDDEGQPVNIEGKCKELSGKGELVLDVPDNVSTNVDCDKPTAVVTWAPPSATFSCGAVNLTCRGAREDGANATSLATGGGLFPQGATSFCCYAVADDKCGQSAGCPGAANDCARGADGKPVGCWTVNVSDEVSMDIDVALEPVITPVNRDGTLERCIEFCMYANCLEAPICFTDDVTFGGIFNFRGKSQGKIKAPKGQWDCISAQDQLHTLRSCCNSASGCLHCEGSQLVADFTGDPELGGNWLVGGNLDAFKKDVPKASLNAVDILDWGTFAAEFGKCYTGPTPGCHDGPNADINGDGCVTTADYQFIIRNFLADSKNCCCQGDAAAGSAPLAEISVEQLRQMGMGDLAVADLNGDGVLNAQDMEAFQQGVRPTKVSNDRKSGKGLRSGR